MSSFMHIDYTDTKPNGSSTMVAVTTECPVCEKEWKRHEYEDLIIVGLALAMCPECSGMDEHGNPVITLAGNNKVWNGNDHG